MFSWQKIKTSLAPLRRIPLQYYFVLGVLLVGVTYLVVFRERTLAYNYGGETCDRRLIILPGLFAQAGGDKYAVTARGGWSVGGQQITATSLCVSPTVAPAENASDMVAYAPWGGWFARLRYHVETGNHPTVTASVLNKPLPVSRPLTLPLSEPDVTFSYQIEAGGKKAPCKLDDGQLTCDVPALTLEQGSKYTASLEKYFEGQAVSDVITTEIETLSPLSITKTSIEKDSMVYDKPKVVEFTTDKAIKQAKVSVWRIDGEAPVELEASTTFENHTFTVTVAEELPRQATIGLKATALEATDGSTPLETDYILSFKTSGGPRVTGTNVGTTGVALGSQIVVTFDQELKADQDIAPLIATSGGVAYQARRGNQLIFTTNAAARCADITITIKPDIKSPHDISGQSAWQYKGRMRCHTIRTIGYSSQGRAIAAYHFGDSGPVVLYTGAIHGNEVSTKSLMDRWIQELEANPAKIPGGKRVIIVPTINPDGLARGSRVNARNVDLNRNFGTGDWRKDIQHTNGTSFPGGGGDAAMSEPETRAIAGFVAQQRPELVVSYHSIGGMVISNQGGQANARAGQYSRLSGYRLSSGDSGEFGYQITGTADDYYRERLGVPSILIELGSHSYHQFERNQAAMWTMLQ